MRAAKRKPKTLMRGRRQPVRQKPQQAIIIRPPSPKPWELSTEETTLLKNAVCKGATDTELAYCFTVARRYELDPFKRQIWFVPRWDKEAENSQGQKGSKVWVPVVGIDGLRHIAARDHADYGAFSEVEFGPMTTIEWTDYRNQRQRFEAPEWARIEAWKKGSDHPTIGKVWWEEIYPDVDRAPMVRRMPRLMLGKCAQAQAIRAAYPKTGGLLIEEETHTREFQDITPGGRLITAAEPEQNKYLSAYEQREQDQLSKLTAPQREVVERRMAEAKQKQNGGDATRHDAVIGDKNTSVSEHTPAQVLSNDPGTHPVEQHAAVPCLFYRFFPESETYQIDGDLQLKKANRDLLGPLYNRAVGAIVATPQQLGKLISQFEDRRVPFRELK